MLLYFRIKGLNEWDMKPFLLKISLFFFLILPACAGPSVVKKRPVASRNPFDVFPKEYQLKAREYEHAHELRMALFSWRIVASFWPKDLEASNKIVQLRTELAAEAETHYSRGVQYFREKRSREARNEFLKALACNPDLEKAVAFLKNKIIPPDFMIYHVKKGDSDAAIAKEVYHDPKLGFLIAYFNPLKDEVLKPGRSIKLPVIKPAPEPKRTLAETSLQKARTLFRAKEYRKAIAVAENIIAYGPSKAASDIVNGSYYALAVSQFHAGNFAESFKLFRRVDKYYSNTSSYMGRLRKKLQVMAGAHFKKGMQYFLNEKLRKAIAEWETTLQLDPSHPRARVDLEKARTMLKNLQEIK